MRKDLLLIFEYLHFLPQRLALSLQGHDVLIFPFLILLANADDVIDLLQDSARLGTISNQTPEGVQSLFENVTFHHFTYQNIIKSKCLSDRIRAKVKEMQRKRSEISFLEE